MVSVKVPATTANLGPGLDTLGMALSLYLKVEMDFSGQGTLLHFIGTGQEEMRDHPENNLVLNAARKVLNQAGLANTDLKLTIYNDIPVGKGLGSSASAIVAGMFAANRLAGSPFSDQQLLRWAVEMEGHGDNIVPAFIGGLCTVMLHGEDVYYQKLALPPGLKLVLAVPNFSLPTVKSRTILPQEVSLADSIGGLQRACFFIGSLANADYRKLSIAMQDPVFQTARQDFIPGYEQVVKNAREAGAKGVTISGAGPSVLAFSIQDEAVIGNAMQTAFAHAGVDSQIMILQPNTEGLAFLDS